MLTAYIVVTFVLWICSIAVNILVLSTSEEKNATAVLSLFINLLLAIWAGSLLVSGI